MAGAADQHRRGGRPPEEPAGAPTVDTGLFDRIDEGLMVADADDHLVFVNAAACRMVGRVADELIGQDIRSAFPGDVAAPFDAAARRARRSGRTVHLEDRRGDAWFTVRVVPSGDGLVVTTQESSARHRADEALQAALAQSRRQQRLVALLAETNEAVFRSASPEELFAAAVRVAVDHGGFVMCWIGLVDERSRRVLPVAWAGEGAESYLQDIRITTDEDPQGRGPSGMAARTGKEVCSNDILADADMAPWRQVAARVGYRSSGAFPLFVDGRVAGLVSVYAPEPGYFDTEETALVRRLAANVSYGWESLLHQAALREGQQRAIEAERRRRAEEVQRERSDRLESLGKLSGGVAHDFNNLLGVILNFVTLLEMQPLTEQVRQDLHEIRAAAQRGADLTRQLLSYARRDPANPQPVDVNASASAVAAMLARVLGPSVDLRLQLDERPLVTVIDPQQLDQVILNLAINARDAMPGGGTLTITTERRDAGEGHVPRAVVRVGDSGVGMAPDTAARAFEPFFTTKPRGQGTGLGLSAVSGIVERAGGEVTIRSAVGQGTTVAVTLPLTDATVEPAVAATGGEATPGGRSETVLVVEDDPTLRRATWRVLESAGFRVLAASDGVEALQVLDHHADVALVVTDVVMPRMGGDELARTLARRERAPKVVMITGHDSGDRPRARRVLVKPVDEATLLRAIREELDGPA